MHCQYRFAYTHATTRPIIHDISFVYNLITIHSSVYTAIVSDIVTVVNSQYPMALT